MGDFRNKARKLEDEAAWREREKRLREGFTVFHFDYAPRLTRRNLSLGEAIRYLSKMTGTKISFWRCPIRGLAIKYHKSPTSSYLHDQGETYLMLHFSDLEDEVEAKKVLVLDLVLRGIDLYRGLPNAAFGREVETVKWLLQAPPSVSADEWRKVLEGLDNRTRPLLRTHEAELRSHLLGEDHNATRTGPVEISTRIRMEAVR